MKQVVLMVKAHERRRSFDVELAYYTAYHAGLFSQPFKKGKFPPYEKHRPGKKKPGSGRQTWQQQQKMARMLNALFGGTTVKEI